MPRMGGSNGAGRGHHPYQGGSGKRSPNPLGPPRTSCLLVYTYPMPDLTVKLASVNGREKRVLGQTNDPCHQ
eukprot:5098151-Pyramimonas_sp.AAC.1